MDLFRFLYHLGSKFLKWVFPPKVIVFVEDREVEKQYSQIFSEYCLRSDWVSYTDTERGVLEEMQRPVSSNSPDLPIIFQGREAFATSRYPEFRDTVQVVDVKMEGVESQAEKSVWPVPPMHTLAHSHVNGGQTDMPRMPGNFNLSAREKRLSTSAPKLDAATIEAAKKQRRSTAPAGAWPHR